MALIRRYLAIGAGLGLFVWSVDAVLDAALFYPDRSLLALMVTDVPPHELYIRALIVACFVGFAAIAARLARQSRERDQDAVLFRRLIEEASDSVFVIDPETAAIEDVNQAACDTYGYDRSTLLESSVADLNPAFDDAADFVAFLNSEEGTTLEYWESTHVRADGTTIPVEISASTVEIRDRAHRLAIVRDIRDRKAREQRIAHYKQAVESSRDLLAAVDTERCYLFANEAYRTFHGVDRDSLYGDHLDSVLDDESLDAVDEHIRAALDGEQVQIETTRPHATRGDRVLDVHYWPLRGGDGTIEGIGAAMRDVTDRREMVEDLRRNRRRYESLFESIRDAIFVADTDRRIVNCNQAFTDLFGYSREEILGQPTAVLYEHDAEFDAIADALGTESDDPRSAQTIEFQKKSGRDFPGETTVFYLRDRHDDIVGYIGLIRDVSDRRVRTSQIQTIDRVLRHNLNNALTVIMGNADAIAAGTTDDPATDAERIIQRGRQLQSLAEKEREITQFLAESRAIVERDAVALVEHAVDDLREEHPEADLSVDLPDEQPVRTVEHVTRALRELLTNAVTHSDRDRPSIEISIESTDDIVAIQIADRGPGIPDIERRVVTGDHDIEPLFHGRGIGLWLVHLIVQYSDGTVEIEDNEPRGSVVTVRLPAGDQRAEHRDERSGVVDSPDR